MHVVDGMSLSEKWQGAVDGSVEVDEGGRVRAVRDIPKGTALIKERPGVVFPVAEGNSLMCVGCCFTLSASSAVQCALCGLPMCSEWSCGKAGPHRDECGVFQRAGFKLPKVCLDLGLGCEQWLWSVAVLRTALAEQCDPRFASLRTDFAAGRLELQVEADTRSARLPDGVPHLLMNLDTDEFPLKERRRRSRVLQWLREAVGVAWLSEQQLLRAATLADLHAHVTSLIRPAGVRELRKGMLYPGLAQLEHSCMPNTAPFPFKGDDNPLQELVVVATRDIAAGEYLSKDLLVTGWMDDTYNRQTSLLRRYNFLCRCPRCEDTTELGAYVGSPCCPECAKKGECQYVVADKDDPHFWRCQQCEDEMTCIDVDELVNPAKIKFEQLEKQSADRKLWLIFLTEVQHPQGPLHARHHFVIKAKAHLQRCIYECRADLCASEQEVRVWRSVCCDLLQTMDQVCPGMHEHRLRIMLALRRLLLRDFGDARLKAALLYSGPGRHGPNPRAESERAEAAKREKEAAEAVVELDKEFGQYFFGVDQAERVFLVTRV